MPHQTRPPIFPESTLVIKKLSDPLIEELGYHLRSGYVERYWLSVLGPSATFLLRRLGKGLQDQPEGYKLTMASLSIELGLGTKQGKNSSLWRSVERICRFNAATRSGELLVVRTALPAMPLRYLRRLPESLQAEHQHLMQNQHRTDSARLDSQRAQKAF